MRPPTRSSARPAMPRPPPKQPGQSSGGSPGSPVRSASVTSRSPGSRLPASKSGSGPPGSLPVMAEGPEPYDGRGPGRLAAGRDTQPGNTHADRGTHKGHQCQEGVRTWPARQRPSWTWRADPVAPGPISGTSASAAPRPCVSAASRLGLRDLLAETVMCTAPAAPPGRSRPGAAIAVGAGILGVWGITCCLLRRGVR